MPHPKHIHHYPQIWKFKIGNVLCYQFKFGGNFDEIKLVTKNVTNLIYLDAELETQGTPWMESTIETRSSSYVFNHLSTLRLKKYQFS